MRFASTLILGALFLGLAQVAVASKRMPHYSDLVRSAIEEDRCAYMHPVYVGGFVKKPGAHRFRRDVTILELLSAAGGISRRPAAADQCPETIQVFRPTDDDPDPVFSAYECPITWSRRGATPAPCKFALREFDLVDVSARCPQMLHYEVRLGLFLPKAPCHLQSGVYAVGLVKHPGMYPFTRGMTLERVIEAAGGLARFGQYSPEWPGWISILRPTRDNPDPYDATTSCSVQWSDSRPVMHGCSATVKEGDVVDVTVGPLPRR
jgi:hypothetical protein